MTTPLTYAQQFNKYTSRQLGHLRERGKGKCDKRGRVLRVHCPCEITLPQYREWVLAKFGGDVAGSCPCEYCRVLLTPSSFEPDHDIPLARGGFNDLRNLRVACSNCNGIKGELTGAAYWFLLRCLEQMPERDRAIVRGRLQKSEKLAATVRRFRGQMFRQRPADDIQEV